MAFSERISRLKSSLIREILAAAQRPEVMSFAGGLPAEPMLPKVQWEQMPASMGQYGMSEGEPALREAIAAEARALGVLRGEPGADRQRFAADPRPGQQAVHRSGHRGAARGADLPRRAQAFQLFGADCVTVPLGAEGPDLVAPAAAPERQAGLAYLIPTFQNPSGVRYSEERRDAAALLDDGVTLIEDEPYRELVFDEARNPAGQPPAQVQLDLYRHGVEDPAAGPARRFPDRHPGPVPAPAAAETVGRPAYQPGRAVAGAAMVRQRGLPPAPAELREFTGSAATPCRRPCWSTSASWPNGISRRAGCSSG